MKAGRKRLYHTLEERLEANRRIAMKAYWRKRARKHRQDGNLKEAELAERKLAEYTQLV